MRRNIIAHAILKCLLTLHIFHGSFKDLDINDNGTVSFEEFIKVSKIPSSLLMAKISVKNRDSRGLVQVQPSAERYFGEELLMVDKPEYSLSLSQSQYFAMQVS